LGDHTETVEILYDPSEVTYDRLLEVFWASHDPSGRPWSRQYMSAIFTHGEEQARLARESRMFEDKRRSRSLFTEIVAASRFYPAEEYHQKHNLRRRGDVTRYLGGPYGSIPDFLDSTLAARLNGLVAGYGSPEKVRDEMTRAGLPLSEVDAVLSSLGFGTEKAKTER
jgi:hypothetical protein